MLPNRAKYRGKLLRLCRHPLIQLGVAAPAKFSNFRFVWLWLLFRFQAIHLRSIYMTGSRAVPQTRSRVFASTASLYQYAAAVIEHNDVAGTMAQVLFM